MGFQHLTEEQRAASRAKSAATRKANREARAKAPEEEVEISEPVVIRAPVAEEDDFLDGLLTDEEKAEIEAHARKRARDDQKKAARTAYAKEMLDQARREIGEMPADEDFRKKMEEVVTIYVDMPRLRRPMGGEHPPEPIIIDQVHYVSGRTYNMPRGRAVFVQWLMDQNRQHVAKLDGRPRSYYDPLIHQMVHQGGVAQGGSSGPGFDSLHRRPA
jgi:hypothetical protein